MLLCEFQSSSHSLDSFGQLLTLDLQQLKQGGVCPGSHGFPYRFVHVVEVGLPVFVELGRLDVGECSERIVQRDGTERRGE
jgi:hypothetical protein